MTETTPPGKNTAPSSASGFLIVCCALLYRRRYDYHEAIDCRGSVGVMGLFKKPFDKPAWHSIVITHRGQSMQEACLHREQFLCSYDGSIYGDREAKKMARRVGNDYISAGGPGQPRQIATPMEPWGEAERKEVEKALALGLIPPHGVHRKWL